MADYQDVDISVTGPTAGQAVPTQAMTEPSKVLTGRQVPTKESQAIQIARYGPRVAAGLATGAAQTRFWPAAVLGAGVAGISEITARHLERAGRDAKLDSAWQEIKGDFVAGGETAALDLALGGATKYLGAAPVVGGVMGAATDPEHPIQGALKGAAGGYVVKGAGALTRIVGEGIKRALMPKNLPPDIEAARTVLGLLDKDLQKSSKDFENFIKGSDGKPMVFGLTPGQLNYENKGLVYLFETFARGGLGSKTYSRFDANNVKHVSEVLDRWLGMRASTKTDPEFGVLVKRILGTVAEPGEAILPVEAFKTMLYTRFQDKLAAAGNITVNGNRLRQFFRINKDPQIQAIYTELQGMGLLPSLEGTAATTKKVVQTTRTIKGQEIARESATTRKNVLTGQERAEHTQIQGQKTAQDLGTVEREVTTETFDPNKYTAAEVDAMWGELRASDVDKVLHIINGKWTPDKVFNDKLKAIQGRIGPEFERELSKHTELSELRKTANSYFGDKRKALENAIITSVQDQLALRPSGVAELLSPLRGVAGERYDDLIALKKAIYFGVDTPAVKLAARGEKAALESVGGMGKKAADTLWENDILRPLRTDFLTKSTTNGFLDPVKLLKNFEQIESTTPELMRELWGGAEITETAKNLANTLITYQNTSVGKSLFIQLKTAGAVGAIGATTWHFATGDDPAVSTLAGAAGAGAILLSPVVLAKALTKPSLIRALNQGLIESSKAGKITTNTAMVLRQIGTMKVASQLQREPQSSNKMQFYSQDIEMPEQPQIEAAPTNPQDVQQNMLKFGRSW